MNRKAWEEFNMSEEDYDLYKEQEKAAEKKAKEAEEAEKDKKDKDSKDKKGKKDSAGSDKEESKDIVIELDGLEDRVQRLTPMSSTLLSAWTRTARNSTSSVPVPRS